MQRLFTKVVLEQNRKGVINVLTEKQELRVVAINSALELARNKTQTAVDVVKEAEKIHDFLAPGENVVKEDDK